MTTPRQMCDTPETVMRGRTQSAQSMLMHEVAQQAIAETRALLDVMARQSLSLTGQSE